nr:MAG TPA: hypothetical protein [Caudoviricetes sp.]
MVKYKILWESLKETADHMTTIEGFDDLKWSVLSKMMKDGEEMFESGELYNGTALFTVVKALEFGFTCLGVIALVMHVIA